MVAQGQNIDDYLSGADALSMYEGVEAAGLGEGIETAMGYTSPEIQFGGGDGNGHFPMPDFAP